MNEREREYRRSLRWYSKRWRQTHGEALLDTLLAGAEAEGRMRPTRREKLDLARRGLGQRLSYAMPAALFAIAFLGLSAVLLVIGAGPNGTVVLSLPAVPAPPTNQLYTRISTGPFPAIWLQVIGSAVFIGGTILGIVLLRRIRRTRRTFDSGPAHSD